MHLKKISVQSILYRLQQVRQQIGFVAALTDEDRTEVERWLPASARALFYSMSRADQQHSLRVCRGLQARNYWEPDLLAAALLHDVGKAEGRVPFWTRPVLVLGKKFCPALLHRLALEPQRFGPSTPRWQRSLGYAWWHAQVGAELAREAGLNGQTVLYIQTHHQPTGPANALHAVDEVS